MGKVMQLGLLQFVPNLGAPTITNHGTPGATSYGYGVVAQITYANGTVQKTAVSAPGSTTTGNATLTGSNFNRATWSAPSPLPPGASVLYEVFRLSGGATQGKIGSTAATSFDDTGLAGDSTTAPSTNLTGIGARVDVLNLTDITVQLTNEAATPDLNATVGIEGSIDGIEWTAALLSLSAGTRFGSLAAGSSYSYLRAHMTAYTAGIATMKSYLAAHVG